MPVAKAIPKWTIKINSNWNKKTYL